MCADYISSIPASAKERIVETHDDGSKAKSEHTMRGKVVGVRKWDADGNLEMEVPLREGVKHGIEYHWHAPGILGFAEPFENGVVHEQARQWSVNGCLIGTYSMVRGTGIDLWRAEREDGSVYLAEVLHLQQGLRHGYEWWVNENQTTVYIERHWAQGELHGIEREWNAKGRVRRGFPRYHVRGERVIKREYLAQRTKDDTLPAFNPKDNEPERVFPDKITLCLSPQPKV